MNVGQDVEAVEAYGCDVPLLSNTEKFNNLIGSVLGERNSWVNGLRIFGVFVASTETPTVAIKNTSSWAVEGPVKIW
jgi:hypothetical protein